LAIGKIKIAAVVILLGVAGLSQPKPRIDFDRLIASLPDLPWQFEVRYVVHDGPNTDMLRIYYDRRVDVIRWRPEYTGSLASVCHSSLDEKTMQHLLELLRDRKFNDLPSDNELVKSIALTTDRTVSVRLGRTIVRKTDRNERENPALKEIESFLEGIQTSVTADSQSKCDMESVPAKP
jgi:hypothetical protein